MKSIQCLQCGFRRYITVVLTGPVLAMKSVVADYLHRFLRIGIVESAYYGTVMVHDQTDETLRRIRRARVFDATMVFAGVGLPVIVDAAFHRRVDRMGFVERLRANSPNYVVGLCCYSDDGALREYRREYRNKTDLPYEVDPQSAEDAEERLREYDSPSAEEPYPFVYFNSDRNVVQCQNEMAAEPEMKPFLEDLRKAVLRGAAVGWR